MDNLRYANIALDWFCLVLSFLPVVYLVSNQRYREKLNQYFLGACLSNMVMTLGDLPDWYFPTVNAYWQKNLLTIGCTVYYTASAFTLFFFICYIVEYLGVEGYAKRNCHKFAQLLFGVQVFFSLISPITGALFTVTADGYERGPLLLGTQVIPLAGYLLFFTLVFSKRSSLHPREIVFLLLYIIIPLSTCVIQLAVRGIALINVGITVSTLVILMNVQFEREMLLKDQEKALAEGRIDIMLSQIQPHFLYNSLGVIYHLCESDPVAARKAINHFSHFLRGNMDSLKNRGPIPFEAELNHVKNYLYLEQQRFGDKLRVVYQINVEDFVIPPLTLQPLVENAVQHGILHRRNGGTVLIRTEETDSYAVVIIQDNGVGMEKAQKTQTLGEHSHIGISNVRARLEEMVSGSMEMESSSYGTTVMIRIPWEEGEGQ